MNPAAHPLRSALLLVLVLVATVLNAHISHAGTSFVAVDIAGESFQLEIANDNPSRNQGLSFRDHIPTNGGMLFVFPDARKRGFWMRNCLVDMDILFLDRAGFVVHATEMFAEPLKGENESHASYHKRLKRYSSRHPAQFALELKHGTMARLGIGVGDSILFNRAELVKAAQ